jgi:hypothetical protein
VSGGEAVLSGTSSCTALADLWRVRRVLLEKLCEPGAWEGFRARDVANGHVYERLACTSDLCTEDGPRRYRVLVHSFGAAGAETVMHDHALPLAVWPMATAMPLGTPLYDMPWELRAAPDMVLARGQLIVRAGAPYAIERYREVFHAVRSRRAHISIVIARNDLPTNRASRLETEVLSRPLTAQLRVCALATFAATLDALEALSPEARARFL